MAMLNDGAILVRQHALGNSEAIGEHAGLLDAARKRMVKNDDLITRLGLIKGIGSGGVFIRIDGVF